MARPESTGIPYFPIVTEWDQKLKLVRAKYKLLGVGCILELWRAIYREGYALVWDEDAELLFADENNLDLETLREIVDFATSKEIFDRQKLVENSVLTSHGIQKQWLSVVRAAHRKTTTIDPEICLLAAAELSDDKVERKPGDGLVSSGGNPAAAPFPLEETTQSKAKQSKAEQSKENSACREPPAAAAISVAVVEKSLAGCSFANRFTQADKQAIANRLSASCLDAGFVVYCLKRTHESNARNPGGFLRYALPGSPCFEDYPELYLAERKPPQPTRTPPPRTCEDCKTPLRVIDSEAICPECGVAWVYDSTFEIWDRSRENYKPNTKLRLSG